METAARLEQKQGFIEAPLMAHGPGNVTKARPVHRAFPNTGSTRHHLTPPGQLTYEHTLTTLGYLRSDLQHYASSCSLCSPTKTIIVL